MRRARDAELIDHFKLTPAQIGQLTDRQIDEWYFHPRDRETGAIKRPTPRAPELTCEQHVAMFLNMVEQRNRGSRQKIPQEVIDRKVEQIKEAHRKKAARKQAEERGGDDAGRSGDSGPHGQPGDGERDDRG